MAKMIAQFRTLNVRVLKTTVDMATKPECVFDGNVDVDVLKCGGNTKVMVRMAVATAMKREYSDIFKKPVGEFDFDNAALFADGDDMHIASITRA